MKETVCGSGQGPDPFIAMEEGWAGRGMGRGQRCRRAGRVPIESPPPGHVQHVIPRHTPCTLHPGKKTPRLMPRGQEHLDEMTGAGMKWHQHDQWNGGCRGRA